MKKYIKIATLMLVTFSCITPEKAVRKCERWANRWPEHFSAIDSQQVVINRKPVLQGFEFDLPEGEFKKFQLSDGGEVQITSTTLTDTSKKDNRNLRIDYFQPPKSDTVKIAVDRWKLTPRPHFYKDKRFHAGGVLGLGIGFILFAFFRRILMRPKRS